MCEMTKEQVKNRYNDILAELEETEQELKELSDSLDADDAKTDDLWWNIIHTEKYVKEARTII